MNKAIANKWLAELKSGDYKHGTGFLRDSDKFCCLGVLCNLHAKEHPHIAATQTNSYSYLGYSSILPDEVRDWAGLNDSTGLFRNENGFINSLVRINDTSSSYKPVIEVIEKSWSLL